MGISLYTWVAGKTECTRDRWVAPPAFQSWGSGERGQNSIPPKEKSVTTNGKQWGGNVLKKVR